MNAHSPTGMLLLSGGIDSPVAGHLAMKAGATVHTIHFSVEPLTDDSPEQKAVALARHLGVRSLTVVNISHACQEMVKNCRHAHYFVLTKRLMFRIAERLAEEKGCTFLVTGESLGQVSSQTLAHLSTIQQSVSLPVVRPLMTLDKETTIQIARRIDTYALSTGPEMCDVLGPKHPATQASDERIRVEEGKLDYPALFEKALETRREIPLLP